MLDDYLSSITARLELWWNSFMAFLDKPVFGHGLGAFEQAYGPHRADHQWFMDSSILSSPYVAAGMSHNLPLQTLIEIGLIGFGLAVWFLFAVCKKGISIPILVALTICMIEFPEQNPATAMMIAVALGLSARLDSPPS